MAKSKLQPEIKPSCKGLFISRFGDNLSDEDFLSLVYLNILGRPANQEGYNFWLAVLKSGAMSREQLIVEFTESDEFKADVDNEANGLLKAAAATDSDATEDDLDYEFPGGELGNEAPVDILIGTDVDENSADGTAVTDGGRSGLWRDLHLGTDRPERRLRS